MSTKTDRIIAALTEELESLEEARDRCLSAGRPIPLTLAGELAGARRALALAHEAVAD